MMGMVKDLYMFGYMGISVYGYDGHGGGLLYVPVYAGYKWLWG